MYRLLFIIYWIVIGAAIGYSMIAFGPCLFPAFLGLAFMSMRLMGPRDFWLAIVAMGVMPLAIWGGRPDPGMQHADYLFIGIAAVGVALGVIQLLRAWRRGG